MRMNSSGDVSWMCHGNPKRPGGAKMERYIITRGGEFPVREAIGPSRVLLRRLSTRTERALAALKQLSGRQLGRSGFPFLQKIEDEFDARRNAQFFIDSKKVVANDSGSTVLGVVCAYLALNLYRAQVGAPLAFGMAFLPAALPLIDAMLAILRRMRWNVSPLYGDRRHFYDLLIAKKWSTRNVALACYGITGIFCLAGWMATKCTFASGFAVCTLTVGSFLILEWRLGALQTAKPKTSIREAIAWRSPNLFENTK
jgi:hypothetical protein